MEFILATSENEVYCRDPNRLKSSLPSWDSFQGPTLIYHSFTYHLVCHPVGTMSSGIYTISSPLFAQCKASYLKHPPISISMSTYFLSVLFLATTAYFCAKLLRLTLDTHKLRAPGPKRRWLIGNLLDMPRMKDLNVFASWQRDYGILSVSI